MSRPHDADPIPQHLQAALEGHQHLAVLAKTPFWLQVLITLYQSAPIEDFLLNASSEELQKELLKRYVDYQLQPHAISGADGLQSDEIGIQHHQNKQPFHYHKQDAQNWLMWISARISEEHTEQLYLEHIRSTWVQHTWRLRLLMGIVAAVFGTAFGSIGWLLVLKSNDLWAAQSNIFLTPDITQDGSLLFVIILLSSLYVYSFSILPIDIREQWQVSFEKIHALMKKNIVFYLAFAILSPLMIVLWVIALDPFFTFVDIPQYYVVPIIVLSAAACVYAIGIFWIWGAISTLTTHSSSPQKHEYDTPNRGIFKTGRKGLIVLIAIGVSNSIASGMLVVFILSIVNFLWGISTMTINVLFFYTQGAALLIWFVIVGYTVSLLIGFYGIANYIRYWITRFILAQEQAMPPVSFWFWLRRMGFLRESNTDLMIRHDPYISFLSDMEKRSILQKEGNGFAFVHPSLRDYFAKMQWEKDLAYYDRMAAARPKYADAWYNKGHTLSIAKRYDEALLCYNHALTLHPKHLLAWREKGFIFFIWKQYTDALDCFNTVLALSPKDSDILDAKAESLFHLKRYDEAIRYCDKALSKNPQWIDVWNIKGLSHIQLSQYEDAIVCFEQVLAIDLGNIRAWNLKGITLRALKRYGESLACYEQSLALDPDDVWTMDWKGDTLVAMKRNREALQWFDRALEIDHMHADVWGSRGLALFHLQQYEESLVSYNRSLTIDPDNTPVRFNHGTLLAFMGQYPEALQEYQQCEQFRQENKDDFDAYDWTGEGLVKAYQEQYEEALSLYDRALNLDTELAPAWHYKGIALNALSRMSEAEESFQRAHDLGYVE